MGKTLNISLVATLTPLQKSLELVGKMMSDFAKSIETTDKKLSDSIKASVGQMNTELAKVSASFDNVGKGGEAAGNNSAKGMKSLRTQIREATLEAQRAAQQFGEFSPEFIAAAKKAAMLKDEMGDMQQVIDALNPDAKMKAFGGVIKGVVGGFQAAQGAMAAFGVESEDAQKTMAKLQGLMALSAGMNELGALSDSMKAFKISIMANIPALNTLKGAMAATGIGLLVIGVAALAANWDSVSEALDGAALKAERAQDKLRAANEAFEKQVDEAGKKLEEQFTKDTKYINQIADAKIKQAKFEKDLATAKGAGIDEIHKLELQELELEKQKQKSIAEFSSKHTSYMSQEFAAKEKIKDIDRQIVVANSAYSKQAADQSKKALDDAKKLTEEKTKAIRAEQVERIKLLNDSQKAAADNNSKELELIKEFSVSRQQIDDDYNNQLLTDTNQTSEQVYEALKKGYQKNVDANAEANKAMEQAMAEYNASASAAQDKAHADWIAKENKKADRIESINKAANAALSKMFADSAILVGESIAQMFTGSFSAENFMAGMLLLVMYILC